MLIMKRVVNRAAVRDAFHRQGARVPPGFLEEVERTVYVILRRAAAGEIVPEVSVNGVGVEQRPLKEETLDRVEAARRKYAEEAEVYLKQSLLKEALREALGKNRIETAWVDHVNAMVTMKVADASVRRGAKNGQPPGVGVPGRVLRAFLRSPEGKTTPLGTFFKRWQDPEFRKEWTERAGEKGKART